ncbi:MAG: DUF1320 family protein [Synergistaceae bacterium]|nr:DUF1320 family protein [Synergistaceae bacterium]MBR0249446.1 DUF1320 family protein [Synergistaceae bacterium]
MSYCSIDDVIHEFTPTLKKQIERDFGEELDDFIAGHIIKAEAFVNASLSRSYSLPLKSPTGIVISATSKIAAYFATIAYSEKDEVVRDKFETATLMLDYLVQANSPTLVDDALSDEELKNSGLLYGSDSQIFPHDEINKW